MHKVYSMNRKIAELGVAARRLPAVVGGIAAVDIAVVVDTAAVVAESTVDPVVDLQKLKCKFVSSMFMGPPLENR